jgi:hypothetical protein
VTGMKVLLGIMAALEIGDGVFTHYAAGSGMVGEGNALMESLVMNGDFLVLKIVGALLCAVLLGRLYRRFPGIAVTVTSAVAVFYTAVIGWNAGVFFGM